MKTILAECAAYHALQVNILENTRQFLAHMALPTDEIERDIIMHKAYALACKEADGDE